MCIRDSLCRYAVRAPYSIFSNFSRQCEFINFVTNFRSPSSPSLIARVLHYVQASRFGRRNPTPRIDYPTVSLPHLNAFGGAGISTCCPSPTPFGLGLGPDLPWGDKPSPGNLRHSTGKILTSLSLLMPAFSLLCSPRPLSIPLQPA